MKAARPAAAAISLLPATRASAAPVKVVGGAVVVPVGAVGGVTAVPVTAGVELLPDGTGKIGAGTEGAAAVGTGMCIVTGARVDAGAVVDEDDAEEVSEAEVEEAAVEEPECTGQPDEPPALAPPAQGMTFR